MTVKARLILLSLLCSSGMLAIGVFALLQLSGFDASMAAAFARIKDGETALVAASRAEAAFKTQVQEWKDVLLRGNDAERFAHHLKGFETREAQVQEALARVGDYARTAMPGVDVEALRAEHRALGTRYREALKHFDPADLEAGKTVDRSVRGMDRAFAEGLDRLVEDMRGREASGLDATLATAQGRYAEVRTELVAAVVLLIAVAGVMSALMVRRIVRALSVLADTMAQAARERDLRLRADVRGGDEIASTGGSFNRMLETFQALVRQLGQQSGGIAGDTAALAAAVGNVDRSMESLNDATGKVAAATEQLTASIEHVRENAEQTLGITRETARLASDGGEVIQRTAGRMIETAARERETARGVDELGAHSAAIGDIVRVIREVAERTNLLALNAAIEAARAGEQGRGFAVVADEVRKLAERTAQATEEIGEKISAVQRQAGATVAEMRSMVDQVSADAELAHQAGDAIVQIRQGAQRVVKVADEISSALKEQATASETIAHQVENIARASGESTTALGQTSQSVRRLEGMAAEMRQTAAVFGV